MEKDFWIKKEDSYFCSLPNVASVLLIPLQVLKVYELQKENMVQYDRQFLVSHLQTQFGVIQIQL